MTPLCVLHQFRDIDLHIRRPDLPQGVARRGSKIGIIERLAESGHGLIPEVRGQRHQVVADLPLLVLLHRRD